MRFRLPAIKISLDKIPLGRIPLAATIALSGLLAAGAVPAGAAPATGELTTAPGASPISPTDVTDAVGAPSPASSGQEAPAGSVLPTGPVQPGAAPGSLVATAPDGQKLPCSAPANPYSGASVRSVFTRPGVTVRKYTKSGRTPLYVTVADIAGKGSVRPGPLTKSSVTNLTTLRTKIAGTHAFAATNGDFFHLGQDGSPYGAEVTRGGTVQKGIDKPQTSLIIQRNDTATIGTITLSIAVKTSKGTLHGQSWNSQYLPHDGMAVFTSNWGDGARKYLRPSQDVREFIVSGHKVVRVNKAVTNTAIPRGGYIIEAQGRAVNRLRAIGLKAGSAVAASKFLHTSAPHGVDTAIGVGMALVHEGRYQGPVCSKDNAVARTVVGIMPGGKRMFIAVAQGQTDSAHSNFTGLTARECTALAYHMKATEAVMLDGGGSAGVVVSGAYGKVSQFTKSADGWDRYIPNGYGFWRR
ncbi:MAG TPA: phosphodiester glycosidase family protein [Mycobacteriales bacterium]|nr:phosphodiester glycosidase family protein [Mycobacteriales bacterium]